MALESACKVLSVCNIPINESSFSVYDTVQYHSNKGGHLTGKVLWSIAAVQIKMYSTTHVDLKFLPDLYYSICVMS